MSQQRNWFAVRWPGAKLAVVLCICSSLLAALATAQAPSPQVEGGGWQAGPLADPLLRADVIFVARKASAWTQGQARLLLLDGDVSFQMGPYALRASRAVIRIDSQRLPGRTIQHLAIYLTDARPGKVHGPISAAAPRLLITASTTGQVQLETDLLDHLATAPGDSLVGDAAKRVADHRAALARALLDAPQESLIDPSTLQSRQARRQQLIERMDRTKLGPGQAARPQEIAPAVPTPTPTPTPTVQAKPVPRDPALTVLPTRGLVGFSADRIVGQSGEQESLLMLIGNVRVIYQGYQQRRGMTLKAQRVVIFLKGNWSNTMADRQIGADAVQGVYLEDNVVASDGEFTVRAPRMYYDLEKNKALLLEAVMFTFDLKEQIPLYLRADVLRQTSATSFNADKALFTTSEFGQPHFAIAARQVTVNQVRRSDGSTVEQFVSLHNTPRFGKMPLGYWPVLAGQNRDVPIRSARVGYRSDVGPIVKTSWDVFSLLGRRRPDGVDLDGQLDWLGEHGFATGAQLDYQLPNMFGTFDSYLVPLDSGEDQLGNGRNDITHDTDVRGYFRFAHRQSLRHGLELSLEGSYVSDETFLEEFFRDQALAAKEYETSLYLTKQKEDWALTLLAKSTLNDFTPQLAVLQTPGYTVDKLPELGLFVTGRNLWQNRLTWFSQSRLSRMRIRVGDDSPGSRGFNAAASASVFGTAPTVGFDTALKAAGITTDNIIRADTRHEISAPMTIGPINVNPYLAGRITAYDHNFSAFAGETEQVRYWGQAGARVSTQLHRNYDQVQSAILDLNRLRHIIEPTLHGYSTATTINAASLPVFDPDVEAVNKGSGLAIGIINTLQTQRGGPQRWRSVDWIRLTNRYVLSNDEETPAAPLPRFFDYRPDLSVGGDHFYSQLLWLVSDSLAVTGDVNYAADLDMIARWHLGMTMDHGSNLRSYLNYHEIDILGTRLLSYGFTYRLTTKYVLSLGQRLDFSADESRQVTLTLERELPRWTLRLIVGFDEVDERQSVGVILIPHGIGGASPLALR